MPKTAVLSRPSPNAMFHAMGVLLAVRESLLADDPTIANDPVLYADMLEGESGDALDVIANWLRYSIEVEAMAEAVRVRRADLADRLAMFERRKERLRDAVRDAMLTLGLRRFEADDFTAYVRDGVASVRVTNEAELSDQFVRIIREPDKIAIGKALKAKEKVAGAELSNPSPIIVIRKGA